MAGMKRSEILRLINKYIGVSSGWLGDFSYRTHADFYPEYCDLEYNPYNFEGTTRARFQTILENAKPDEQAKIIRGVLKKYPPDPNRLETRTLDLCAEFDAIADRLEQQSPIQSPSLSISSEVVERAISDVETLIESNGAISGVDRIHTALHGFLRVVCESAGVSYSSDASMAALFKRMREEHPAFNHTGARAQDVTQVLRAMGAIMDALIPIRNSASVAHPNATLLDAPEAMLAINAARTILHYLDAKLSNASP